MTSSRFLSPFVILALAANSACVWDEFDAAKRASADYRECLDANPSEPDRCAILKEEMNRQVEAYDSAAKEYWDCDDKTGECERLP